MNKQVALISEESNLSAALQALGYQAIVCPAQSARDALRWTMELAPDSISLCIVVESATFRLQPIETALDPAIPLICWVPPAALGTFTPQAGTRAFISFAAHAHDFSEKIAAVAGITGATPES